MNLNLANFDQKWEEEKNTKIYPFWKKFAQFGPNIKAQLNNF